MTDLERRLRAAMRDAAEQWSAERRSAEHRAGENLPAGLLAGVRRRHRRHVRRVGVGWTAVAAAVLVAIPPVTHALRQGPAQGGRVSPGPTVAPATSKPSPAPPTAARGTVLLGCADDVYGQLPSNWRATSLEAGPLWFVYARQQGYVHDAGLYPGARTINRSGKLRVGVMIVEVKFGATVVLRVAPQARSYFRFLTGFYQPQSYSLRDGVYGLTFASCPRGTLAGGNGLVTDFYLGFLMLPGNRALVDVWPSAASRPIRVIFTCPGLGCEG